MQKTNTIIKRLSKDRIDFYLSVVFALLIFIGTSGVSDARGPGTLSNDRNVLRLNPDYKIKRLSTGTVIAYPSKTNGEVVKHEFEDIYAEVLLGALRKQTVEQLIPVISRKYYYAEDECRREIKHAIHVLEEWQILIARNPRLL